MAMATSHLSPPPSFHRGLPRPQAREEVLRRMALNGYITEETAAAEANAPLPPSLSVAVPQTPQAGGYYTPQRKVRPVDAL